MTIREKIVVIDFGSQLTKLIARRIREYDVYSEILSLPELSKLKNFNSIKGIILSGGPSTVTKKFFPTIPNKIFQKKVPILGICYGLQLIVKKMGGKVVLSKKNREFGRTFIVKKKESILTKNFFKKNKSEVWMSHQDAVLKLPKGFIVTAKSKDSPLAVIENKKRKIYGIQFHPEVTHTILGMKLIKNFYF